MKEIQGSRPFLSIATSMIRGKCFDLLVDSKVIKFSVLFFFFFFWFFSFPTSFSHKNQHPPHYQVTSSLNNADYVRKMNSFRELKKHLRRKDSFEIIVAFIEANTDLLFVSPFPFSFFPLSPFLPFLPFSFSLLFFLPAHQPK